MNRHVTTALAGAAVLLLATGCGLLPGVEPEETNRAAPTEATSGPTRPATSGPTRPAQRPPAATASPDGQDDLTATVDSFVADGSGFARLTFTLKNVGSTEYQLTGPFAEENSFRVLSVQVGNVDVIDEQAQMIQSTLADTDRICLCHWTPPGADYFSLEPGDWATFTNMFQISDQARTVTVLLPGFQPVKGVPVDRP
ncbi:MAG: hypothetical protein GEV03_06980 [Streptosporangiales bacterium]|nr:hypothetical protein [Streptosporangiales bacterium]